MFRVLYNGSWYCDIVIISIFYWDNWHWKNFFNCSFILTYLGLQVCQLEFTLLLYICPTASRLQRIARTQTWGTEMEIDREEINVSFALWPGWSAGACCGILALQLIGWRGAPRATKIQWFISLHSWTIFSVSDKIDWMTVDALGSLHAVYFLSKLWTAFFISYTFHWMALNASRFHHPFNCITSLLDCNLREVTKKFFVKCKFWLQPGSWGWMNRVVQRFNTLFQYCLLVFPKFLIFWKLGFKMELQSRVFWFRQWTSCPLTLHFFLPLYNIWAQFVNIFLKSGLYKLYTCSDIIP